MYVTLGADCDGLIGLHAAAVREGSLRRDLGVSGAFNRACMRDVAA